MGQKVLHTYRRTISMSETVKHTRPLERMDATTEFVRLINSVFIRFLSITRSSYTQVLQNFKSDRPGTQQLELDSAKGWNCLQLSKPHTSPDSHSESLKHLPSPDPHFSIVQLLTKSSCTTPVAKNKFYALFSNWQPYCTLANWVQNWLSFWADLDFFTILDLFGNR